MQTTSVTKNGIEIHGYRNEASHGFFISLFLRAGSMYESEEECGITHFLEHVSIRNVNKQMEGGLYSLLDKNGIEFNASTYSEMVQFYVSGAKKNFAIGAEVITKLFSPIILTKSEIDLERRRIKAEIRENDDKSSLLAFANTFVNAGTSLSRSIVGTPSSVNKINAMRLESYRKRVFNKNNVFFYLTGNYSDEDVHTLSSYIEKYTLESSDVRNGNVAPVPSEFGKRSSEIYIKNSDFTMARFTFDIDMEKCSVAETDLIYDMLFSGYNAPFFVEMSENRGIFYDISGGVERYRNIGYLSFSYEVREKDLADALALTVKILKDFKSRLFDSAECMKAGYVDNANMLLDDVRELNFTMAYDNLIMGLGYRDLDERINTYKSVTPEDISRVACQIFRPENLTLTLKANKKRIDTAKLRKIIKEL